MYLLVEYAKNLYQIIENSKIDAKSLYQIIEERKIKTTFVLIK